MYDLEQRIRAALEAAGYTDAFDGYGYHAGMSADRCQRAGFRTRVVSYGRYLTWGRVYVCYLQPSASGNALTLQFPKAARPILERALGRGVEVEPFIESNTPSLLVTDIAQARREDFWMEIVKVLRTANILESNPDMLGPVPISSAGFLLRWLDDKATVEVTYIDGFGIQSDEYRAAQRAHFDVNAEPALKKQFGRKRVNRKGNAIRVTL